jgi:1,4-alpha-glucan branching enzyme
MAALETVMKINESISRHRANGAKSEIEFSLNAPGAKKVYIAGTFNGWNTKSMPMKKSKDGIWKIMVKLSPGCHEYKYFLDGTWASPDIPGAETVPNCFGTSNCLIAVE